MKNKLQTYLKHPGSLAIFLLTNLAALLTVVMLAFIIIYILVRGVPYLTLELFSWEYNSDNVSMLPSIINTLLMVIISLAIAAPLGIFSAVYMVEYAKKGNKIVKLIRVTTETLAGIPSIVYGLFGMLFFVGTCHLGLSLLSGSLTVAIMILPTIMRTTEEALLSVPNNFREGSFGLGAGKLRTVFKVVLPSAVPGILSGIILSVGKVCGETAAIIYTAGTVAKIPGSLFDSTRTLAVHMYMLSGEGFNTNQAFATAVVLLIFVICINMLSNFVGNKLAAKKA